MKNNSNKASNKNSNAKVNTGTRYDEAMRAKICAFLKTHTNQETKKEFGCSAHFAGKLRAEAKIPHVARVGQAKAAAKAATPAKGKGKAKGAAAKAVAAVKATSKAKKTSNVDASVL